jgi:hypothetical protein
MLFFWTVTPWIYKWTPTFAMNILYPSLGISRGGLKMEGEYLSVSAYKSRRRQTQMNNTDFCKYR